MVEHARDMTRTRMLSHYICLYVLMSTFSMIRKDEGYLWGDTKHKDGGCDSVTNYVMNPVMNYVMNPVIIYVMNPMKCQMEIMSVFIASTYCIVFFIFQGRGWHQDHCTPSRPSQYGQEEDLCSVLHSARRRMGVWIGRGWRDHYTSETNQLLQQHPQFPDFCEGGPKH